MSEVRSLVRVVAPRFVAGMIMEGDRCIDAAPILWRHVLGRTLAEIARFSTGRGWQIEVVDQWEE